ncbi:redoxin domain-containing protein [Spirosoma sp.]|uniref:redoxin domain-containing protein n=1 Tax=Spirosoma sp. TaxID=1899569 RepID=UPI0026232D31|nr:redoxin domain-containing protein [Spirosoma sp.]MCX6219174.1 redoxin domain-containing protein [Spirosoma sp.]
MSNLSQSAKGLDSFYSRWIYQAIQPGVIARISREKSCWSLKGLSGIGLILLLFIQLKPASSRITVYAFLSTECPISQQYVRTLEKLHQRYSPVGVRFVAMFPLSTDSPQRIKRFRSEYGLPFAGRPDGGAQLARQFRVRATPEVVVMQANGTVRYQGAIDDWYISLGKHRPHMTSAYLQQALDALLANQAVTTARTEVVGCLLN